MSTWQQWEEAVVTGHIKYLYKLTFKAFDYERTIGFTTGKEEITLDGVTYKPRPIVHDDINFEFMKASTTISVPANKYWIHIFFVVDFIRIYLTIYRYREELNEAITIFHGKYVKATLNNGVINVDFILGVGDVNSEVLTYWVQRYCNHIIFDYYCGLNPDDYKVVLDGSGFTFTPPNKVTLSSSPYFLGDSIGDFWLHGFVIFDCEIEIEEGVTFEIPFPNIISAVQSPTDFMLKWPIPDYVINVTTGHVRFYPSCNGDAKRCRDVFGNEYRMCGWPDMPSELLIISTTKDLEDRNRGTIGVKCESVTL